jgi:dihydrofolate reductase
VRISLIVAADEKDVIGSEGVLPWHFSEDLKRFRRLTDGHVVVAGRLTNDSMMERLGRPLPGRITVVATRQVDRQPYPNVVYKPDVPSAMAAAEAIESFAGRDEVFVIGGGQIYREALPLVQRVYLTRVRGTFDGDCELPTDWLAPFDLVEDIPHEEFAFRTYERG